MMTLRSFLRHAPSLAIYLLVTVLPGEANVLISPVVVSSAQEYSAAFAASNSVDNGANEYASLGQGLNTFVEYSFGTPQTFDKIIVVNRNSTGQSDWIGDFTLTMDGSTTVSVAREAVRGTSPIHYLGGSITGTNVRLDVDAVGVGNATNNTGIMEVIFIRTPTGQTQIPATVMNAAQAFSNFYRADKAVDGMVGRSASNIDGPDYASLGQGVNTFVDFDLGVAAPVGGFDWIDRIAAPDRITAFDLIFSINSVFGDTDDVVKSYANSGLALGDAFNPVSARYIRFDVTANSGTATANTGMSEIVFYQQVPEPSSVALFATATLGAVIKRRR